MRLRVYFTIDGRDWTAREMTFFLAWPLWAVAEGCCWLLTRHKRWSDGTTGTIGVAWEPEPREPAA